MRRSLRRSCAACAKSKHSCDLGTPRCSRCTKRRIECEYTNEPLTAKLPTLRPGSSRSAVTLPSLSANRFGSLDPFDSYPHTRLDREHVQRLIHSFLTKIAFQYYPLDLSENSNPFLVSWWPLALDDPALFHVSLQTACLDEELIAQRGFQTSDLLMVDSVALLRRKVQDQTLAVQDGTMNSVITLAAIEFGKGNFEASQMHVEGVKRMVDVRGGINEVRQTSPLTARMVSWISMIITGSPQFDTQNDLGIGHGIAPIPEWQMDLSLCRDGSSDHAYVHLDEPVGNVLFRLRIIFERAQKVSLSTTRLHDLTCFVVHRLLPTASDSNRPQPSPLTECMRNAVVLYMLIIHGTTYYPHTLVLTHVLANLRVHLEHFLPASQSQDSFVVWLLSVGMVASIGTDHYHWLADQARGYAASPQFRRWEDVFTCIKGVLWCEMPQAESSFRPHWDAIFGSSSLQALPNTAVDLLPGSNIAPHH